MSTLTKILIVLLTVSAIFLCGVVVTYVANADNYKQKNSVLKAERDALKQREKGLKKQLSEKIAESQQLQDKLSSEAASLKKEVAALQDGLRGAEREKAALLQKVNSWTSITKDFYETTDKQGQLLKNALGELDRVRTAQVKERKELDETTTALVEKMAIIETLQAGSRRLLEEKAELQNKLDEFLRPVGKVAVAAVPVTPERDVARPAIPVTGDISLKGLITEVDLKNSMAGISVGAADGVKIGMRFHVTRGEEFLCDVLIIDVDPEEAVGILELVQQSPRVGDNVSTSL